ncbi:hypothetical protein PanWU01x14_247660 [Parasponia andersonii]|uniref:Uncharacterized protein n=1 Tax=Parasponia andersonii TaxID=3476 RepID=A0A2P5BDZ4_PARAD|nr:hypothetical protein PanWU01x14_247660 [Parasponia andersonii]
MPIVLHALHSISQNDTIHGLFLSSLLLLTEPSPEIQPELQRPNYFLDIPGISMIPSFDMFNTFESLEPRAVKAISDGLCVPNGVTPSIHYIRPLTVTKEGKGVVHPESLIWLDSQSS